MSGTVLILKDLSHPTCLTVVIVWSCWAFDWREVDFTFVAAQTSGGGVLLGGPKSLLPNYS